MGGFPLLRLFKKRRTSLKGKNTLNYSLPKEGLGGTARKLTTSSGRLPASQILEGKEQAEKRDCKKFLLHADSSPARAEKSIGLVLSANKYVWG